MPHHAFIGTYTDDDSEGIYTCSINADGDPVLARTGAVSVPDNPSFLALHPSGDYLYAVHEVSEGGASAFRVDESGGLDHLNRVESGAGGGCHCDVHPSGDYLFVAHYTGGAVSVLPIADDGSLEAPSSVVVHEGSSVDEDRQSEAHPHSIRPGPDGEYVYVPDLGMDQVVIYAFDEHTGDLAASGAVDVESGAGPRHLAFHPDEDLVYLINELDSTIDVYRRSADGGLDRVERVSTLPPDYEGESYTADVNVHPSGEFLYGSNRGHDSIAVFDVDAETGELDPVGYESTGGEWPRHFALDPSGRYLFAENEYTSDVVTFAVDEETGDLDPTGERVEVPEPVCMMIRS